MKEMRNSEYMEGTYTPTKLFWWSVNSEDIDGQPFRGVFISTATEAEMNDDEAVAGVVLTQDQIIELRNNLDNWIFQNMFGM